MEKEEEIFFVNVAGADELKRDLLESSRTVVEILKDYEKFNSANDEKQKEIKKLKSKINEISRLVSRLRSSLPPLKLKTAKKSCKKVKEESKKPVSELNELEDELNEIESKLGSLS